MTYKLISALDKEFKNEKGEIVRGTALLLLNPETGETRRHFVAQDNQKGYTPEMVAKITGKDVEISTIVRVFNGKMREVLEWIRIKQ